MKTQKQMIELFVESNLFNSMDYDIQDEYPTFDANKDDAKTYIFDRCMDGANIFDFIPLAIDQCLSKEDGINLIDEILTSLCEMPEDGPESEFLVSFLRNQNAPIAEMGAGLQEETDDSVIRNILHELGEIENNIPIRQFEKDNRYGRLHHINKDWIWLEGPRDARSILDRVFTLPTNTYDWIEEYAQEQSLKLDAQAAEHYIIIYHQENEDEVKQSVDWLFKNGYPVDGVDLNNGEPRIFGELNKSIWKSPGFKWLEWYQCCTHRNMPTTNPKNKPRSEEDQALKLALEDAIGQLHYLEDTEIECPFNELRYSTRKSIIKLRTQLERLFPDSKLIEKYKEVTLD